MVQCSKHCTSWENVVTDWLRRQQVLEISGVFWVKGLILVYSNVMDYWPKKMFSTYNRDRSPWRNVLVKISVAEQYYLIREVIDLLEPRYWVFLESLWAQSLCSRNISQIISHSLVKHHRVMILTYISCKCNLLDSQLLLTRLGSDWRYL